MVRNGSGMGLSCSGDIADAALVQKSERYMMASSSFCARWHIKMFLRFKDDIFMIVGRECEFQDLLQLWKSRTSYFRLHVERIYTLDQLVLKSMAVSFLDVQIEPYGTHGLKFRIKPYRKPTTLWTPLMHTSRHAPFVHKAWPTGYLMRLRRHSTNRRDFQEARDNFLQDLRINAPGHPGLVARAPALQSSRNIMRTSRVCRFQICFISFTLYTSQIMFCNIL